MEGNDSKSLKPKSGMARLMEHAATKKLLVICAGIFSALASIVSFVPHIARLPLGFHLIFGSGKLRKVMDENIEKIEGFIAHQFPDLVASMVAPIVMVIILRLFDLSQVFS